MLFLRLPPISLYLCVSSKPRALWSIKPTTFRLNYCGSVNTYFFSTINQSLFDCQSSPCLRRRLGPLLFSIMICSIWHRSSIFGLRFLWRFTELTFVAAPLSPLWPNGLVSIWVSSYGLRKASASNGTLCLSFLSLPMKLCPYSFHIRNQVPRGKKLQVYSSWRGLVSCGSARLPVELGRIKCWT